MYPLRILVQVRNSTSPLQQDLTCLMKTLRRLLRKLLSLKHRIRSVRKPSTPETMLMHLYSRQRRLWKKWKLFNWKRPSCSISYRLVTRNVLHWRYGETLSPHQFIGCKMLDIKWISIYAQRRTLMKNGWKLTMLRRLIA